VTGDFESAERLLMQYYYLRRQPPYTLLLGTYRAAVSLAHLQLAQGHEREGRALLEALMTWIDQTYARGRKAGMLVTRAEARMLLGDREGALRDLRDSFIESHDHTRWWYTLRHNPVWNDVRDDPVFGVIEADVQAFLARERAKLAALQASGEVPRRPATVNAVP
jgi:hypothetical protein